METLNQINEAVRRLKLGEVVAFPTETFFGLGVDPSNSTAVEKLIRLKERFSGEGISLIAAKNEFVNSLPIIEVDSSKRKILQDRFWPGALTIVLALKSNQLNIAKKILAADGSLAIRVSSNPIARKLAAEIGGFITATSANPHGKAPAVNSEQVRNYFPDMFIVEGLGQDTKPSTIVDLQKTPFEILREGAVSSVELKQYLL